MANSDLSHLMIGLPGTGKTTFLAALWHVLRNSETVPGALQLAGVRGDRRYLNLIEQQWMACLPIERTAVAGQAVAVRVQHPSGGQAIELAIPDMSGEMYEVVQWGQRERVPEYAHLAETAAGALLFLHPDVTIETDPITQVDRALVGILDSPASGVMPEAEKAKPWDPKRTPTQVKLVELLQFFLSHAGPHVQLAVIISAWDSVIEKQATPEKWLSARVPLLHQFLKANDDRIIYSAYGVSAQGGPLKSADGLRSHTAAVSRIRVAGPEGESNDITAPIRWLMASGRTKA